MPARSTRRLGRALNSVGIVPYCNSPVAWVNTPSFAIPHLSPRTVTMWRSTLGSNRERKGGSPDMQPQCITTSRPSTSGTFREQMHPKMCAVANKSCMCVTLPATPLHFHVSDHFFFIFVTGSSCAHQFARHENNCIPLPSWTTMRPPWSYHEAVSRALLCGAAQYASPVRHFSLTLASKFFQIPTYYLTGRAAGCSQDWRRPRLRGPSRAAISVWSRHPRAPAPRLLQRDATRSCFLPFFAVGSSHRTWLQAARTNMSWLQCHRMNVCTWDCGLCDKSVWAKLEVPPGTRRPRSTRTADWSIVLFRHRTGDAAHVVTRSDEHLREQGRDGYWWSAAGNHTDIENYDNRYARSYVWLGGRWWCASTLIDELGNFSVIIYSAFDEPVLEAWQDKFDERSEAVPSRGVTMSCSAGREGCIRRGGLGSSSPHTCCGSRRCSWTVPHCESVGRRDQDSEVRQINVVKKGLHTKRTKESVGGHESGVRWGACGDETCVTAGTSTIGCATGCPIVERSSRQSQNVQGSEIVRFMSNQLRISSLLGVCVCERTGGGRQSVAQWQVLAVRMPENRGD